MRVLRNFDKLEETRKNKVPSSRLPLFAIELRFNSIRFDSRKGRRVTRSHALEDRESIPPVVTSPLDPVSDPGWTSTRPILARVDRAGGKRNKSRAWAYEKQNNGQLNIAGGGWGGRDCGWVRASIPRHCGGMRTRKSRFNK